LRLAFFTTLARPLSTRYFLLDFAPAAANMSENILFENSFKVTEINSAKYDRVSRIKAFSEGGQEVLLTLDVNTELYPLNVDDRMTVALALSLNLDGSKDDGKGWRNVGRGEQTLADEFDYVCHGKIYRFEEGTGDNM
jgi:DNA-directed RNA polymerases I, II, and III subunit RPABC3